jgi:hypothetical protein
MNDLIHADIFFVVTTVVVIVVGAVLTIALIYLVTTLRRIRKIADLVHDEAVLFREDVHDLRDVVRREGFKLKSLFALGKFFKNFMDGKSKKSKKS